MEPPVDVRRGRVRSPLVLPEGVEAGLVGGLAVAAVFFVRDLWKGDAMRTPELLGTLLVAGVDAARSGAPIAGAAALYHTFHFVAWTALGFVGSALMARAERTQERWVPPLAVVLGIVPLAVLDVFVRTVQIERLHLWAGGLVGIASMGVFLAWRHPGAVSRAST